MNETIRKMQERYEIALQELAGVNSLNVVDMTIAEVGFLYLQNKSAIARLETGVKRLRHLQGMKDEFEAYTT